MDSDNRREGWLGHGFQVGEWAAHVKAGYIERQACICHVRPMVMDLLVLLAEHAGEVVGREEILERVWNRRIVADSVLSRNIAELRQLLDDTTGEPRYIQTVPKRGYRLIAPVTVSSAESWPRVAVLPFANLGNEPSEEFFAAGMTDALITELGRMASLRVISRQSVLHLQGSTKTVPEIAGELGVDAVVEGSTLRSGERVRVTCQLIKVAPEAHVWAESFEIELHDVLRLQQRIARQVAQAIRIGLVPPTADDARPGRVDPRAHLAFLRGRYLALTWTQEGLSRGFDHLQEAVAIDPTFAPAFETIAMCWTTLGYWGHLSIREAYPQARDAALRALELDPTRSDTYVSLGFVRWLYEWDFDAAVAAFRRGRKMNPSSERALLALALFLVTMHGDRESCLAYARQALELDPLSQNTNFSAAWLFMFAEEYERAITQAESTLSLFPDSLHALYTLGWANLALGRIDRAEHAMQRAASISPDPITLSYSGHVLARGGQRDQAERILADLLRSTSGRHVPPLALVILHAGLGNLDEAFDWLGRCLQERDSRLFWLNCVPAFAPLREDPRYAELIDRLGISSPSQRSSLGEPVVT